MLLLSLTTSLQAGIYTWKDADGRTHFGDRPPVESQAQELELRINTYTSPEIQPREQSTRPAKRNNRRVVIYSTDWCGVCKRAKNYFKTRKIPFQEHDVEKSARGKQEFQRLGGKGVPIILVGDQRMHGFSEAGFESLYNQ